MSNEQNKYNITSRIIHLGLMVFGIAAYLTHEAAEEGEAIFMDMDSHTLVGLIFTVFILWRVLYGFIGAAEMRFANWMPFTGGRFQAVMEDIRALFSLRVPERDKHVGLSGLVQFAGIVLFLWLTLTGLPLYFLHDSMSHDLHEALEEMHEIGEVLVPLYLLLHVGAVILHAVMRHPIWRRMF